jgi:UDP-N-acetylmuramate: L-alanyl-gamma-D-glutamyl-meso-diaminopimelate ligase
MLDQKNNKIPAGVRNIHLIGICGTAMGALASILKEMCYGVTGSDQHVYPPMSDFLRLKGIEIKEGFHASHLDDGQDLVVVGNVATRDNPEVERLGILGLNYCSMPQAVNHFVAGEKHQVVVTGTHGKTTTSAIIASILDAAGLDPSFMIGGILNNFNSNYRLGGGATIVIEGDEYDTAFFDKEPKFLHYHPRASVLTSVEFDHADIFNDLDHVRGAFGKFIQRIPEQAVLLYSGSDRNVRDLVVQAPCRNYSYGVADESHWQLTDVVVSPPLTRFTVLKKGCIFGSFTTNLIGEHNLLNTLAAIGVADDLGIELEAIQLGLTEFKGVKRRQEVRGRKNGVTVIDDFAHHPTAVRETIRAVKPFYPKGRLLAVFEPRTNSSMRRVFQDVYPACFDGADIVCIRRPPMLHKIPTDQRFSSQKLVRDLQSRGKKARFFPDTDSILDFILQTVQTQDVILVMSNGGFDNIHARLLERL